MELRRANKCCAGGMRTVGCLCEKTDETSGVLASVYGIVAESQAGIQRLYPK